MALTLAAATLLCFSAYALSDASIHSAYEAAYANDAPVRNFVYLFLRIAGVVWVAAEWFAAIVLIRAYTILKPLLVPRKAVKND